MQNSLFSASCCIFIWWKVVAITYGWANSKENSCTGVASEADDTANGPVFATFLGMIRLQSRDNNVMPFIYMGGSQIGLEGTEMKH